MERELFRCPSLLVLRNLLNFQALQIKERSFHGWEVPHYTYNLGLNLELPIV